MSARSASEMFEPVGQVDGPGDSDEGGKRLDGVLGDGEAGEHHPASVRLGGLSETSTTGSGHLKAFEGIASRMTVESEPGEDRPAVETPESETPPVAPTKVCGAPSVESQDTLQGQVSGLWQAVPTEEARAATWFKSIGLGGADPGAEAIAAVTRRDRGFSHPSGSGVIPEHWRSRAEALISLSRRWG